MRVNMLKAQLNRHGGRHQVSETTSDMELQNRMSGQHRAVQEQLEAAELPSWISNDV